MEDKFVQRAKNIISKILYITIATSARDGQPWNSPVYSAFDDGDVNGNYIDIRIAVDLI